MKKKEPRRLTLCRETLRALDEKWMDGVAGGAPSLQYSRCDRSCGIACTVITCPCEES